MVADAQRKTAGKYAVFQSVIQPPLCHAPGIRAHAEDGQVSAQSRREGNAAALYRGDDRPVAYEIAHGAPVGEKLQRLEIGHGVVKPGAVQTSVKHELPIPQLQPPADSEHGVGVVLFHREHLGSRRGEAQRVKVPDDLVRFDSQFSGMFQAAVGGEDVVVFFQRPRQRVKLRGAENHTAAHGLPSCFFYFTTFYSKEKGRGCKQFFNFAVLP